MKRPVAFALSIFASCVFTVALAGGIAYAQDCPDYVIGTGGVDCSLTGTDANFCYYDCNCGKLDDATCCSRMADMGIECYDN